jgi:hypothetical protein
VALGEFHWTLNSVRLTEVHLKLGERSDRSSSDALS